MAMGIPSLVAGILIVLNGRMGALESKFDTRFDLLMSKLIDVDNRLVRVEERLGVK